jgi:hypothetical protein
VSDKPTRRGIVDPWRVVEPLHKPAPPPAPAPNQRINLDQIDFDANIRPMQQCAIRCRSGSILMRSNRIANGNDALRDLAQCLTELSTLKDMRTDWSNACVALGDAELASNARGAFITTQPGYTPATTIVFAAQTYDDGMLRLIKFLNLATRRHPAMLKSWGVVPMMR